MKIRRIILSLFFIGFITLPFTDFAGLKALGEHKRDLSAHIFLLGLFFFILEISLSKKIKTIKSICYTLFITFFLWCIISATMNFESIPVSSFKGRSGTVQFIKQLFLSAVSIFGFIPFFHFCIRKIGSYQTFLKLRKAISVMLIITFVFCMLETALGLYGYKFLRPIYDLIITIIHKNGPSDGTWRFNRINGFTYEPPYLAMYLIAILPFMLTYLFDDLKKFYYTLLILILVYLCGSRTALIVCITQVLFFIIILVNYILDKKSSFKFVQRIILITIICLPFLGGVLVEKTLHTIDSLTIENKNRGGSHNVSNVTRISTQLTALEIFKENPIAGVGLGQQGFYLVKNYPDWAIKLSYEIRDLYINEKSPVWPPGYSLPTRLLAETGIIGFLLFFGASFMLVFITFRKMTKSKSPIIFALILTLFVGLIINSLQFDSLRSIPFWFTVSYAIIAVNDKTLLYGRK